jgi:SHS2 domain-containing protein
MAVRARHSWAEHVGELELHLFAADEAGVFKAAVGAVADVLADEEGSEIDEWHDVSAEGADRPVLLAAWLEELIFLAEHDGVVPLVAEDIVLHESSVEARIGGYRGEPPHLVKAVTYHRLAFEPHERGWRATVVLDV